MCDIEINKLKYLQKQQSATYRFYTSLLVN